MLGIEGKRDGDERQKMDGGDLARCVLEGRPPYCSLLCSARQVEKGVGGECVYVCVRTRVHMCVCARVCDSEGELLNTLLIRKQPRTNVWLCLLASEAFSNLCDFV